MLVKSWVQSNCITITFTPAFFRKSISSYISIQVQEAQLPSLFILCALKGQATLRMRHKNAQVPWSPFDETHKFLLQFFLTPSLFKIVNTAEIIDDVSRLAKINLLED